MFLFMLYVYMNLTAWVAMKKSINTDVKHFQTGMNWMIQHLLESE